MGISKSQSPDDLTKTRINHSPKALIMNATHGTVVGGRVIWYMADQRFTEWFWLGKWKNQKILCLKLLILLLENGATNPSIHSFKVQKWRTFAFQITNPKDSRIVLLSRIISGAARPHRCVRKIQWFNSPQERLKNAINQKHLERLYSKHQLTQKLMSRSQSEP